MNLLVCVKQVPDTNEIKIDPVTNTLIRAGVPSIVNTFDAYALELAARIKDTTPGTRIVVVSMGPPQAKDALKECLSTGADAAYLVSDRVFGGSDTLATSYILSTAIAKIEETEGKFDIIFCGKQAIDGDTAQVGPEIAEHMDIPQVTYAVDVTVEGNEAIVKQETDTGHQLLGMNFPCLITVTKTAYDSRFPSIKSKMAANRAEIPTLTSEELVFDAERVGLKGSPTKVKKTFTPVHNKTAVVISEETGVESAVKLFGILSDANVV
jgi:Electron transfer flavoprotein, beta subunit